MTQHPHPEKNMTVTVNIQDGKAKVSQESPPSIHVIFVQPDGKEETIEASIGLSLLEVAHKHKIDLEGACEGSLACSTCHVIVDEAWYPKLEEALEEEEDMLDLAFGLTSTSRLGCQIILTKKLDGLRVKLPAATRNMAS